ncbi:DNA primase large subunit PriL [Candidatus Bathyarchaeota archaeon A05DMB-2]|nr:DNA primase large subunit PriL [Candidatus Bathyarchaeota archaeon A05DMB-2]
METVIFTENDLAKYPFLKDTAEYMKKLGLKIEELENPEMAPILDRAQERVKEAILSLGVGKKRENHVEIPSFPVAIMLAIATKNSFIKKRYALAEAKQAFSDMQFENNERIMAIAADFDWNIALNRDLTVPLEFALSFIDYLRNTTHLRDKNWKLVNRLLANGKVYLNKHDVARLLQEEVQHRIEKKLEAKELPNFPEKITVMAEHLLELAREKIGKQEMEGFPKVVSQSAFPPCIVALYEAASKGRHLSHVGRFTLTAFLVNIGMPPEKVTELFKSFSDYNERLTRYQIEHIAGERGSRTQYTSPQCSTLQTHAVCTGSDALCRRVHHPLTYYRIKLRQRTNESPKK